MLNVSGIAKRYGGQIVLADVTWGIPDGARIGLTGPNGAGKSTLLRIIAGQVEPDAGAVALPRGATVGYLPQHILGTCGVTVRAYALSAFAELHALEARRTALEQALATVDPGSDEYPRVMERYMAVCEEWDHPGRYDTESEAEAVLRGLGFRADGLDRDCAELSGGWQMRAALAQLLLRRPDILLLDEPTNYLDLEARTWLEEFLTAYPGTVIMVAHDRYFLDVTVDRIAEVLHGRVTEYPMGYSRYLEERRSGRAVLELAAARKRYGDVRVYDGADVLIERGQRVALVGPNGAGKTTLLKLLGGVVPLDAGTRRVGHNVRLGYFAQDHAEMLDAGHTVLEEVMGAASVEAAPHVRGLLGAFLFSGDAVDKRVSVLS